MTIYFFNYILAKSQNLRIGLGISIGILLIFTAIGCFYGFKRFRNKLNSNPSTFQKNNEYVVFFVQLFWVGSFLLSIAGSIIALAIGFTAIVS